MFKRIRGERGFTLVELLVVLAILAILVAIVVPNLTGVLTGATETAKNQEKDTVQSAIDTYYTQDYKVSGLSAIEAQTAYITLGPGTPSTFGTYLRRQTKYYYIWSDDGLGLSVSP